MVCSIKSCDIFGLKDTVDEHVRQLRMSNEFERMALFSLTCEILQLKYLYTLFDCYAN